MDIKKSLKDVIVLVAICAVFAVILAYVNSITAPIIADRLNAAANEAYMAVMPGAKGFEDVDLSEYKNLPTTVKEAKRETSGLGYAIKLETKGYSTGMVLIVGVSADGVVTGSTCIASNETWGLEAGLGEKVVGKDINTIVDVEAGVTSLTVNGYRSAVEDAINAAAIFGGASIDARPEEVKFAEKLSLALPEGEGAFTKMVLLSALEGVDSVYEADNGKGYVCVIGTDSTGVFLGVNADGVAVGDMSAEHKALAEAAIASVKANVAVDVDLSAYADNSLITNYVNYVKKTGNGTYMIEIKTSGNYTADTPIVMLVVIDAEGKILDAQTVSHNETPNFGGLKLEDGALNSEFIGKDETAIGEVDVKNGATITSTAYKNAILNAFSVVKILEGESVDTRTEEEKFQDALEAALPEGGEAFTKYFKVEVIEGIDSIYVADNGAGYVCVIGSDSTGVFIGVGSDGVAVGEVSDEHKALAEAAVATISVTELTDVDLSTYTGIHKNIVSVKKTATGNYVIRVNAEGYGKKGEYGASGKYIVIDVSFGADGKILDSQTVSHGETAGIGGPHLVDGAYNSNFIGKTEAEANEVDTVAQCTLTTEGYKKAILRAFAAVSIIEGGAN